MKTSANTEAALSLLSELNMASIDLAKLADLQGTVTPMRQVGVLP